MDFEKFSDGLVVFNLLIFIPMVIIVVGYVLLAIYKLVSECGDRICTLGRLHNKRIRIIIPVVIQIVFWGTILSVNGYYLKQEINYEKNVEIQRKMYISQYLKIQDIGCSIKQIESELPIPRPMHPGVTDLEGMFQEEMRIYNIEVENKRIAIEKLRKRIGQEIMSYNTKARNAISAIFGQREPHGRYLPQAIEADNPQVYYCYDIIPH